MDLRLHPVRRLAAACKRLLALAPLLAASVGACTAPESGSPLRGFLTETAPRRAALTRSLWFRDNDYAQLRLAHYATTDAGSWDRLPEWRPPSVALRRGATSEAPLPLPLLPPEVDSDAALEAALVRLGEAAFFDYPAQLVGGFELALRSPNLAAGYGLWQGRAPQDATDAAPRLGGLVRVELPGNSGTALALSCASCHARAAGERIEPGPPAAHLDIGALAQDQAPPGRELPEGRWGPGRLDVSPDGADNPVAIPDLRVLAFQRFLHHEATLRNDPGGAAARDAPNPPPLALAVRIETLLVTTLAQQARPPTSVALGLALYLRSLALPTAAPGTGRGQELFAAHCQHCHAPPDYAGEPVALAAIGTDPAAGQSRERGTLTYRTPTLRAVATRPALLHDGRVRDLAALLDPARLDPGYAGALHGGGPVAGHPYGLELPAAERAALIAFLQTL